MDMLTERVLLDSRRFLADCESIWKMFCMSTFNVSPDKNPPSWKDLYRYAVFKPILVYMPVKQGSPAGFKTVCI